MSPEEFVEAIRKATETELSRLGSSKALYADTDGEMEADAVLAAAAAAEHAAQETFASWAATEDDERAREVFERTAEEEADHHELVVDEIADHEPGEAVPDVQRYLRDLDDTVERAGGFVGRTLAADRSKTQLVGFFVGDADPQTADLFRDLGDDLDAQLERGLGLLADVCDSEADRERALEAAVGAVEAAYGEYVERLESMGVDPKPVC